MTTIDHANLWKFSPLHEDWEKCSKLETVPCMLRSKIMRVVLYIFTFIFTLGQLAKTAKQNYVSKLRHNNSTHKKTSSNRRLNVDYSRVKVKPSDHDILNTKVVICPTVENQFSVAKEFGGYSQSCNVHTIRNLMLFAHLCRHDSPFDLDQLDPDYFTTENKESVHKEIDSFYRIFETKKCVGCMDPVSMLSRFSGAIGINDIGLFYSRAKKVNLNLKSFVMPYLKNKKEVVKKFFKTRCKGKIVLPVGIESRFFHNNFINKVMAIDNFKIHPGCIQNISGLSDHNIMQDQQMVGDQYHPGLCLNDTYNSLEEFTKQLIGYKKGNTNHLIFHTSVPGHAIGIGVLRATDKSTQIIVFDSAGSKHYKLESYPLNLLNKWLKLSPTKLETISQQLEDYRNRLRNKNS